MRKLAVSLIFSLILLCGLTALPQNANVQYTFTSFQSTPQAYSLVSLSQLAPIGVNGSYIVVGGSTVTLPTGGNGSVTFTNVQMGRVYMVSFRPSNPSQAVVSFTNSFPISLAGTNVVDASQYVFWNFLAQGAFGGSQVASISFVTNLVSVTSNALAAAGGVSLSVVTNIVNAQTNGLATTNYVNAATNLLASTNWVGLNYYPTSNPSAFVTAAITNLFATTNYANSTTNSFTDTARKSISYFQPADSTLTNLSGVPTNRLAFTNSPFFDTNGAGIWASLNATNNDMVLSNSLRLTISATNTAILTTSTNLSATERVALIATNAQTLAAIVAATNGYQQGITNIINGVAGSGAFIANNNGFGTNTVAMNIDSRYGSKIFTTNEYIPLSGVIYFLGGSDSYPATGPVWGVNWIVPGGEDWRISAPKSAGSSGLSIGDSTSPAPQFETGTFQVGEHNDVAATSIKNITRATILGGSYNIIQTNGDNSVIIAGQSNYNNGAFGLVSGQMASNNFTGTWIWADKEDATFASTAANQFLVRANGGVGFNTNAPPAGGVGISGSINLNGQSISSFSSLTNNVVLQQANATNITAVGYLSIGSGLTFIVSTNNVGVTNCGNPLVNGTYKFYTAGPTYTNLNDNRFTISFSNPTWFLKGTNVSLYQASSLTGTWSVIGNAVTPVPVVFTGGYIDFTGFTRTTPQDFSGSNDPNGIVIAPVGSTYIQFTNGLPKVMLVNTNGLSGWY